MREKAYWWMREKGCVHLSGPFLRPRSIRLGVLSLAREHGALCWYRTSSTGRQWTILDENSEWHSQIEVFVDHEEGVGNGEGELLVCKASLNPNDAPALKRALEMFDTQSESDVLLWAEQPEYENWSIVFIAPSWVEPIRLLLSRIVEKQIVGDYTKYMRPRSFLKFSNMIDNIVAGLGES
jgi:hypothetical protein